MAELAHMTYRKKPAPSDNAVLEESLKLFKYSEEARGLVWAKDVPKRKAGEVAGGSSGRGYLTVNVLRCRFIVHRIVWLWHHGYIPNSMIDHINGDKRDNRIENLRIASPRENVWNAEVRRGTHEKGVSVNKAGNYVARIQLPEGKKAYLGTYRTEQEAAAAYVGAATILQGQFAAHLSRATRPVDRPWPGSRSSMTSGHDAPPSEPAQAPAGASTAS